MALGSGHTQPGVNLVGSDDGGDKEQDEAVRVTLQVGAVTEALEGVLCCGGLPVPAKLRPGPGLDTLVTNGQRQFLLETVESCNLVNLENLDFLHGSIVRTLCPKTAGDGWTAS